jgi:AraC-like DNA-binding protein
MPATLARRSAVLEKIAKGKISRKLASDRLEISERHVNRLMKAHGIRRPPSAHRQSRHDARLTAQARRETRARAAKAHLAKQCSVEQAALQAGCSIRTIYRWAEKMMKTGKKTGKNGQKRQKATRNTRIRSRT